MNNLIENKFCLVTALFNINREKMSGNDGRTWQSYLDWFEKTLQIKAPMIIFVEEDTVNFINQKRNSLTKIITSKIEEIPYFYLKEKISVILKSDFFKSKIDAPERIECQDPMYTIVQYSKFKWLEKAIEINPFNSKYFFWIDAGASRHFDNFDFNNIFPNQDVQNTFDKIGQKFLMQLNMEFYKDLAYANSLPEEYLWDARAITCGSFFGGESNTVKKVAEYTDDILINKMINKNFINNEQIALAYLLKNRPDIFIEYKRYNGKHMDIFTALS